MRHFRIDEFRPLRIQFYRLVLGIGLAVSATALPDLASARELSAGVVKIGIINDQTGPLSDNSGPGSVVAAKLAVDDFRKLSPDLKVEIIVADHQNKPDIGAQIVRKWFDVDGVDMVADVGNSAVALAIQSIARDKNKIVIYSAVGTTDIGGKQCSRTGLMWLHDNYNLVTGSVRRLVAQGYDSWFFIAADYAFGRNMVEVSQRTLAEAGAKSLGAVFHPLGNADYSSFLLQAQASKAKVVAFANAGEQLVTVMKQWNEFGMNATPQKPVAELMFLTDVHAMGVETAKGLTTVTAWYWGLNEETRAFGQRFFKLHKTMPTAPQAAVYSAVLQYLKAVAAIGTDETDAVLDKMRSMPVDDFYARGARLRADSKLAHDFYLVEVKKPQEVKTPWDYYNVLETISADKAYMPLSESECPRLKTSAK
ncbi:ABC transporter substrate-binding protein [Bradyrhizobium barranii subsp. apii]|uniref:ABC transporter substrate-binding protein n=1 Tax=Bradyrhizobium barranii subsp. apii TaxID=2819348 RepID=A0A8T5V8M2_9BRAD|nr:ABC transporter substrate-binding protein [Bradyrhizobium barranii]UPT84653.1 ABC transporter substrate-binding protein [Bradyrhizobium barranii subsp. apii]UPT93239.1 ABC transporter substrate-binding protein [Bradyrhizobium barranii subsp. apii]